MSLILSLWEGVNQCLKWYTENNLLLFTLPNFTKNIKLMINKKTNQLDMQNQKKNFHIKSNNIGRLKSDLRIGPHNIDVISILIGSILGDTHLEKRKRGIGTRIIFEQCNRNVEYIMWFHKFFSNRGYCNETKPKLITRIKKGNKTFYQYRVSSYTFTSLNWLHDMFYKLMDGRFVKTVPQNLEEYLTPLALAIWFMDDGSKIGKTIRIATNCFQISDLNFLCKLLKDKYNLDVNIQKSGFNKGNILYIKTSSRDKFIEIVKPYMLPSMLYKLGL